MQWATTIMMVALCIRGGTAHMAFNKSRTTCLNCTAGFDLIPDVVHCSNSSLGTWACAGMPYMHNITVMCMDEPSFACDQNACTYPVASAESCKMLYYLRDAPRVRMNDVSILTLHASKHAASRRQLSKPQLLNLGEGGTAISKLECTKEGVTDTGARLWSCSDLETRRLGSPPITTFRVRCEAYDAHTILAGSCRLEYTSNKYTIKYLFLDMVYCFTVVLMFGVITIVAWFTESGSILFWNTGVVPSTTRYTRYHMD
jgi:hypothetical protein